MSKRIKTDYPGVFYRESDRIGGKGTEKVFYVVFKQDGKVYEEKAGRQYVNNMTPAKAATVRGERIEGKRKSRKEIREAKKKKKDIWTIERLWDEYKKQKSHLKGLKIDESRYEKYLKKPFGAKEPKKIIPLDVDRVRLKMLKTKKPQTVKLTLSLLRRIVNFGYVKRLSAPLPFAIEMPKVNNLKTEDLTPKQLKNLLAAIDKDDSLQAANLMRLALFTGMRRGELFKLKWEDIDDHRGFILLRDPKGGPNQKIPLNDGARKALGNHIRTESPYVFPGRGGRQRVDINHQVTRIRNRAGLPKDFRPLHGLRHAYASMLASSGKVDLYTLQKLLTHKDPRMTQRYAHLRDETLKKAAQVAADLVTEAMNSKEKVFTLEGQG